jgi:hypothetical protein
MIGKVAARVLMHKTTPPGTPLFHRLLAGVAAVIAFSFLAALLLGALLIGISYFVYYLLITRGVDNEIAMISVGGFLLLLICIFIAAAIACAKHVRHIPKQMVATEAPLAYRISSVANAFVDGLLTSVKH